MEFEKLEYVKTFMEGFNHTVTYDQNIFSPSIGYTERYTIPKRGQIVHVYINNADQDIADFLYIHECGHILFGHMRNIEEQLDEHLTEKILASYPKVKFLFGNTDAYKSLFISLLFNVVMDFEVNSCLFTPQEFLLINSKIQTFIQDPKAQGLWPGDYGLPPGLTWNQYLTYILLNPAKFLHLLRIDLQIKQLKALKAAMAKEKGSVFNGVLSQYEYEEIRRKANANISVGEKDLFSQMAAQNPKVEFGIPTGTMNGQSTGAAKPCLVKLLTYVSMPDLVNKVRKLLFAKKRGNNLRDEMYNSNRRKFNTNVIIPKVKNLLRNSKPNLYILIDVSGSVDPESVHDFIKTFQNFKNEFKNTMITFWTTDLVAEMKITDPMPQFYGGGTYMASGIEYIKNKYRLKSNDVFFLISDFCDELKSWETALKPMTCRKFAIDWKCEKLTSKHGFDDIIVNSKKGR